MNRGIYPFYLYKGLTKCSFNVDYTLRKHMYIFINFNCFCSIQNSFSFLWIIGMDLPYCNSVILSLN